MYGKKVSNWYILSNVILKRKCWYLVLTFKNGDIVLKVQTLVGFYYFTTQVKVVLFIYN